MNSIKRKKISINMIFLIISLVIFFITDGSIIFKFVKVIDIFIYYLWATLGLNILILISSLIILRRLKKLKNPVDYYKKQNKENISEDKLLKLHLNFIKDTIKMFKVLRKEVLINIFQIYFGYKLIEAFPNENAILNMGTNEMIILAINIISYIYFLKITLSSNKKQLNKEGK